jgi:chromosome segregation ATPase
MDDNNPTQEQLNNFIQTFTEKFGRLRAANQTLVQKIERDNAFYPEVQQSLEGLNRIVQEINNKIATVKRRVSVLREDNDINSQELDDEQKSRATLVELIDRNTQQRQHITRNLLPQNQQQLQELQAQLANITAELANCNAQLAQAQAMLQTGTAEQQRLAAEIERKINEHQGAIQDLNNQHQTAIQKQTEQLNAQHQTDLQNLTGQHQTDIRNQAEQLNAQHQTNIQQLQEQHQREVVDINNAHQGVIGNLIDEHNQLQRNNGVLQQAHTDLQGQQNNLRDAHNLLIQNNLDLQGQRDTLQGQHDTLQGQHNDLQAAHANSANNINTLIQQRTALIAAIREADTAIDESIQQIGLIINSGANAVQIRDLLQGLLQQLNAINQSIGDVPAGSASAGPTVGPPRNNIRDRNPLANRRKPIDIEKFRGNMPAKMPENNISRKGDLDFGDVYDSSDEDTIIGSVNPNLKINIEQWNGPADPKIQRVVTYQTIIDALNSKIKTYPTDDKYKVVLSDIKKTQDPVKISTILKSNGITFNQNNNTRDNITTYSIHGGKKTIKNMKKLKKRTKKHFKQKAGFTYPKYNMMVPFQKRKNIQYSRSSNKITSKNSYRSKSKSSRRSSRR